MTTVSSRVRLTVALAMFADTDPDAALWARYPDLDPDEDERTDEVACETMSARLARALTAAGFAARTVVGTEADEPLTDYHVWVVVVLDDGTVVGVDLTARQFHNLAWPPDPAHADLPCPLVWDGGLAHPVVGYRTVVDGTGPFPVAD